MIRRSYARSVLVWTIGALASLLVAGGFSSGHASAADSGIFDRDNLVAWCIVPFDAKHRGPADRAAMLQRLGFRRFAYDWRAEHLPTFDAEIEALARAGIELTAVWFPSELNADAQVLLTAIAKSRLTPQLWVMMGDDGPANSPAEQQRKVTAHAAALRPVVEAAAKIGCKVALYNHGGWFGEPENQIAIIEELRQLNVGIVYNLHHGHDHVARLETLLPKMKPFLLAFNLNGMTPHGDRIGQKIWPLGHGADDLAFLRVLKESGWSGPVGILGHTQDDAEERLLDNLDGLDWLLPQLDGKNAGPRPKPRTISPPPPREANAIGPAKLQPVDQAFHAVVIDQSPDEAYMAVKVDHSGNIFVGGREKVFRFEPSGESYRRRELIRLPDDSIVIGLEFRGDDLYVLAAHGLYLVPDGRVATENLTPRRILWGVPLDFHVSFHCLAWGPEGDLYLNHGDPLLGQGPDHHGHWTLYAGPRAEPVSYTGAGAVLRVRPDGTRPQVVATGLRGPVGLAFDGHWNLFTNDNDHESQPDQFAPARLLHVTHGADFGWPNGWMARKSPERFDLRDCLHGDLGRGVPCDLVYYDEPTAGDMRGELLMCRWDRFAVSRYAMERDGASFRAVEHVFAQGSDNARPTGIAVDTLGRIFVTSLYLVGNVVTPKCPSDLTMIARTDLPHGPPQSGLNTNLSTGALTAAGEATQATELTKVNSETLWRMLGTASWETRRRAHLEILRRGGDTLKDVVSRLQSVADHHPAAPHAPWLAAAAGDADGKALLRRWMLDGQSPTLHLQSLRAIAERPDLKAPVEWFAELLDEPTADRSAERLAALTFFLTRRQSAPTTPVALLAAGGDTTLRQTAAILLARHAPHAEIARLCASPEPARRLAGALAAGLRLTSPSPTAPAPVGVVLHEPTDTAFFSTNIQFADAATPILLRNLAPVGAYTTAEWWVAARHSPEELQLYEMLRDALHFAEGDPAQPAERVRLQAAHFIELLKVAGMEPEIAAVRFAARSRELFERASIPVGRVWRIGPFVDSVRPGEHLIERGPIDFSARHSPNAPPPAAQPEDSTNEAPTLEWNEVNASDIGIPLPRQGIWFVATRIQSRERQRALIQSSRESETTLRHNGREVPRTGKGFLVDLQPGGNDLLARATGGPDLALSIRAQRDVAWELPERSDNNAFAERLKSADRGAVPAEFLTIDWSVEGRRGDIANGRRLFGSLGCAKCHAVTSDQTGGGAPSLADAGKRFSPPHIAESVLLPDRQIAAEFRATHLTTRDGLVVIGLVVRESATELEVLLPDASRRVLATNEIEARAQSANSPMPTGLVKTSAELRDLISYLLSDNPAPP